MSKSDRRRIVIGDVHGHYEGLMTILEAIAPNAEDEVYFLGDLIDRGPKSSKVIKLVRDNSYYCLRGNHEQMLLDAFPDNQIYEQMLRAWIYSGGDATIASYGALGISEMLEDIEWMRSLPTYLDLGDIWLVHAGVDPDMPLEKQGSEQFCWIRDRFHRSKTPYFSDKLIIIGHTITSTFPGIYPGKLVQGEGWLGIDTGAYSPASGWLTGLDITHKIVYQFQVFKHRFRTISLEEATIKIYPDKLKSRVALPR